MKSLLILKICMTYTIHSIFNLLTQTNIFSLYHLIVGQGIPVTVYDVTVSSSTVVTLSTVA